MSVAPLMLLDLLAALQCDDGAHAEESGIESRDGSLLCSRAQLGRVPTPERPTEARCSPSSRLRVFGSSLSTPRRYNDRSFYNRDGDPGESDSACSRALPDLC